MNQSATGGIPVQKSTGRPVAKGEEQIGSTVPMPSFARRPSTMNSFCPAELHFDKLPTPPKSSCWKMRFEAQVGSCSGFPSEAMSWIEEVEMVDSVDI